MMSLVGMNFLLPEVARGRYVVRLGFSVISQRFKKYDVAPKRSDHLRTSPLALLRHSILEIFLLFSILIIFYYGVNTAAQNSGYLLGQGLCLSHYRRRYRDWPDGHTGIGCKWYIETAVSSQYMCMLIGNFRRQSVHHRPSNGGPRERSEVAQPS